MRVRILLPIALCAVMAGCVTEDIKETGISRSTAEGIAERHCPQYPDKYGYVDQSEWNSDGKFWMVALTDRDGDHGKAYKISRSGEIIDSHAIDRDSEDYSHHYYGPGSWYYW